MDSLSRETNLKNKSINWNEHLEIPIEIKIQSIDQESDPFNYTRLAIKMEDEMSNQVEICDYENIETNEPIVKIEPKDAEEEIMQDPMDVSDEIKDTFEEAIRIEDRGADKCASSLGTSDEESRRPGKRKMYKTVLDSESDSSSMDDSDQEVHKKNNYKNKKTNITILTHPSPPILNGTTIPHCNCKRFHEKTNKKLNKIFNLLRELQGEIHFLRRKQDLNASAPKTNETTGNSSTTSLEWNHELPLQTLDNLLAFEQNIQTQEEARLMLKRLVKQKLGDDPKESGRRILKAIMTYELAAQISWSGKTGKFKFSETSIARTVTEIIAYEKQTSDKVVERAMADWIRQATRIPKKNETKKIVYK